MKGRCKLDSAGALASCAAPLVGLLAERWFGFSGAAARSYSAHQDQANAQALGSALLFFCLAPWISTLLVYSGAHARPPPPPIWRHNWMHCSVVVNHKNLCAAFYIELFAFLKPKRNTNE